MTALLQADTIKDIQEFYLAGALPWVGSREVGPETGDLIVKMWGPDSEGSFTTFRFDKESIEQAFLKAISENSGNLCCLKDILTEGILTEGIGYGCVTDIDIVLQYAAYSKVVYG